MHWTLFTPIREMDYLTQEACAETRHEFVDGTVHAMAQSNERHCTIAGNLAAACHAASSNSGCRPFISQMRLRLDGGHLYYYPDVMVVCNPQDTDPMFKSLPCLLAEVSSPSTEGTDQREKMTAYLKIPTLHEYLIIAQDRVHVQLYQRQDLQHWHVAELGAGDVFTSVCMKLALPVEALYATLEV